MPDFPIAITFALPTESSELRRQLCETRDEGDFILGKIDGHTVAIAHTGVGAQHGSAQLEALLHRTRPRAVISSGFAGAVASDLRVGDLIFAKNFSDRELLMAAQRILSERTPRTVKLFTSTSIVDSLSERNQVAGASGAAAVDMETGSIFEICKGHGIPLLSVRAISDTPTEPLPAPPGVLFDIQNQRTSYRRLVSYLVAHPTAIPRLIRFGREINGVRAKLTEAIVILVHAL